jgi:hypothetical protein
MSFIHIKATVGDMRKLFRPRNTRSVTGTASPAATQSLFNLPLMKLTQPVYKDIVERLRWDREDKEAGGVLLGPSNQHVVTHFAYDDTGLRTAGSWTFGHVRLNEIHRQ